MFPGSFHVALRGGLLALALLLAFPASAGPAQPVLSPAETASLDAGEVLIRPADGAQAIALVKIPAPPRIVWSVVSDPDHLRESTKTVKTLDVYGDQTRADGTREQKLAYVIKVAFTEVQYNVIREYDVAEGHMTWSLDGSRDNDIVSTDGSFTTWETSDGGTLFGYRAAVDSGRRIPAFIRDELTEASVKRFLTYVRETAPRQAAR